MSWNTRTALRLGRVSNLPTVWTNVLAAWVLSGAAPEWGALGVVIAIMTLFYVGGMYLNDAFDASIDALERPERAIPSGEVSRTGVFIAGFAMLAVALAALAWFGTIYRPTQGLWPLAGGALLAVAIVFYDAYHKANPLSPLVMGACRVLVYVTVAWCAAGLSVALGIGALAMLCYLIGLTYVAKQETFGTLRTVWPLVFLAVPVVVGLIYLQNHVSVLVFWVFFVVWILAALWLLKRRAAGDIPRAVVSLIAGIALLDALLLAASAQPLLAVLACAGFVLTVYWQRHVPGT